MWSSLLFRVRNYAISSYFVRIFLLSTAKPAMVGKHSVRTSNRAFRAAIHTTTGAELTFSFHLPPASSSRLPSTPLFRVPQRYLISGAALEFHPLGKALPVRCQPENYWGSEGQYRAWVLE